MSSQYVCGNDTEVYVCNEKVSFRLNETEICLGETERNYIREYWEEAMGKNPSLFDGEVLSIKSVEKLSNEIKIQLEKTHYSHMTYIMNHTDKKMTKCRAVAIGGYLITSDGYYAFGKMAQKTSFPGVIQCIGGGLTKEDIIAGDPVHAFLRECKEEIGLTSEDIVSIDDKKYFFIRDNQTTVGISYIAKIGLDKEALLRRFEDTVTDGEIETLVFARENREGMSELLKQESLVDYIKVTFGKQLSDKPLRNLRGYDFD